MPQPVIVIIENNRIQLNYYKDVVKRFGFEAVGVTDEEFDLIGIMALGERVIDAYICEASFAFRSKEAFVLPKDGVFLIQYLNRCEFTPNFLLHSRKEMYKPFGFNNEINLKEFVKGFSFAEFHLKDFENLYIKDFLERITASKN